MVCTTKLENPSPSLRELWYNYRFFWGGISLNGKIIDQFLNRKFFQILPNFEVFVQKVSLTEFIFEQTSENEPTTKNVFGQKHPPTSLHLPHTLRRLFWTPAGGGKGRGAASHQTLHLPHGPQWDQQQPTGVLPQSSPVRPCSKEFPLRVMSKLS